MCLGDSAFISSAHIHTLYIQICTYVHTYVCTVYIYVEPSQPKELSVLKFNEAMITLSWKKSNPSDVPITGYEVQYRKRSKEFKKVENSLTHEDLTCEVTGLVAQTEYQFRVAAINAAGHGPFTDVVTQFTSKSLYEFVIRINIYAYV